MYAYYTDLSDLVENLTFDLPLRHPIGNGKTAVLLYKDYHFIITHIITPASQDLNVWLLADYDKNTGESDETKIGSYSSDNYGKTKDFAEWITKVLRFMIDDLEEM